MVPLSHLRRLHGSYFFLERLNEKKVHAYAKNNVSLTNHDSPCPRGGEAPALTALQELYLHLDLSIERRYMDNPLRHSCLPVVYFLLFKVGITGVLSASVLFLCLGIGLGWRTSV
jgi:hypothetical protein